MPPFLLVQFLVILDALIDGLFEVLLVQLLFDLVFQQLVFKSFAGHAQRFHLLYRIDLSHSHYFVVFEEVGVFLQELLL